MELCLPFVNTEGPDLSDSNLFISKYHGSVASAVDTSNGSDNNWPTNHKLTKVKLKS